MVPDYVDGIVNRLTGLLNRAELPGIRVVPVTVTNKKTGDVREGLRIEDEVGGIYSLLHHRKEQDFELEIYENYDEYDPTRIRLNEKGNYLWSFMESVRQIQEEKKSRNKIKEAVAWLEQTLGIESGGIDPSDIAQMLGIALNMGGFLRIAPIYAKNNDGDKEEGYIARLNGQDIFSLFHHAGKSDFVLDVYNEDRRKPTGIDLGKAGSDLWASMKFSENKDKEDEKNKKLRQAVSWLEGKLGKR